MQIRLNVKIFPQAHTIWVCRAFGRRICHSIGGRTTGRMANFFIRAAATVLKFSYELENDDFRRTKQFGDRWKFVGYD